jgi:flavodoxin I
LAWQKRSASFNKKVTPLLVYHQDKKEIKMMKTGIFYGSTLGHCQNVAKKIQAAFLPDAADLINIEDAGIKTFEDYSNLILGTSTWGVGEMQEGWEKFAGQLEKLNMSGKKVAFFGVGDQVEWADSFVNGMGMLHHRVSRSADVVGFTSMEGYDFEISLAIIDNQFVGLVIDDVNQPDLTNERITNWVAQLKKEFV